MGHEIVPTSQTHYHADYKETDNAENIKYLGVTITNALKWNTHVSNISAISAHKLIGPLAFLDVTYQHVHMIKSRHTCIKD